MKKLLVFAIAILGFSAVSFGQNVATATVGATIITPIAISKTADMNFGTILATAAGSVTLVPGGTNTYTGVSHYNNTGAVAESRAIFQVTGNYSNTYGISITAPVTVSHTGGGTMPITAWTVGAFGGSTTGAVSFTLGAGTGTAQLSATGGQTFEIGATLGVAASQTAGLYTAASNISVTVNYN